MRVLCFFLKINNVSQSINQLINTFNKSADKLQTIKAQQLPRKNVLSTILPDTSFSVNYSRVHSDYSD